MQRASRGDVFSGRVMVIFAIQTLNAVVGIGNGILLARLLGPAGKGDYYLLVLVPSTAMVFLQLGLPQAFTYFAAQGRTAGLMLKSVGLTIALSAIAFAAMGVLMSGLRESLLRGFTPALIIVAFLAFPLALSSTFSNGVITGRQAVRWYAGVVLVDQLSTTLPLVVIALAGAALSVEGAILIYLFALLVHTAGFALGARQLTAHQPKTRPPSTRELFRYGLPFFPSSLASFFSYRIDAYLITFLIVDASVPLGYYSMAIGLAEMVFFFPRAVSTLLLPHVAGSLPEESARQVPLISRITLLISAAFAVALIPAAWFLLELILPAFQPAFAPLLVILPGVVALSAGNVVSGYLAGIGRPGITSTVNVAGLVVNAVVNLLLIPPLGIVGAAAASLVSYSLSALLMTAAAARAAGAPLASFWIPGLSDLRYVVEKSVGLVRQVWQARSARSSRGRAGV